MIVYKSSAGMCSLCVLPNRALAELFSAREHKVPSRCGEPFLTLRNVPWHADEFITVSLCYMPIKNKNVERYCQSRKSKGNWGDVSTQFAHQGTAEKEQVTPKNYREDCFLISALSPSG